MALDLLALKNELLTDPASLGYAPLVAIRNDTGLADILNHLRNGITPSPVNGVVGSAVVLKRPDCSPSEILEAIDVRDFAASPAGVSNIALTQSWLESITQFPRIRLTKEDGTKTTVRKNIDRLVADTQGSQTRLDAVAVRNGSRAELLFGVDTEVSSNDIAGALN